MITDRSAASCWLAIGIWRHPISRFLYHQNFRELVGTGEDPESRIEREIWRLGEEGLLRKREGSRMVCAPCGEGKNEMRRLCTLRLQQVRGALRHQSEDQRPRVFLLQTPCHNLQSSLLSHHAATDACYRLAAADDRLSRPIKLVETKISPMHSQQYRQPLCQVSATR
jgi:hypothetical protein